MIWWRDRERILVHEAAHLTAAAVLGARVFDIHLSDTGGQVVFGHPDAEIRACVNLAGACVDALAAGGDLDRPLSHQLPNHHDLGAARRNVKSMRRRFELQARTVELLAVNRSLWQTWVEALARHYDDPSALVPARDRDLWFKWARTPAAWRRHLSPEARLHFPPPADHIRRRPPPETRRRVPPPATGD